MAHSLERREQTHNQPLYIYPDVDIQVHFTALKVFEKTTDCKNLIMHRSCS